MWLDALLKRLRKSKNKETGVQQKNEQEKPVEKCDSKPTNVVSHGISKPSDEDYENWRSELWPRMERMAQKMQQASQAGDCSMFGIRYILQGTKNYGCLMLENIAQDGVRWSLSVRVMRVGSDLCVMHYIKKGTSEEIQAYLRDENNMDELMDSLKELSVSVDKHV